MNHKIDYSSRECLSFIDYDLRTCAKYSKGTFIETYFYIVLIEIKNKISR